MLLPAGYDIHLGECKYAYVPHIRELAGGRRLASDRVGKHKYSCSFLLYIICCGYK